MLKTKKEEFTIRGYRETDREACRGLWRELVERHREIYADPTIGGEHPENYFDRHLAKVGPTRIWVAASDDKVVGFASLVIEGEEVTLDPLVVSRALRGKGAGTRLTERVISEARALGAKYLNAEPVARNAKAFEFYHKLGFANIGHVQLFMDLTSKKWPRRLKLLNRKFHY